ISTTIAPTTDVICQRQIGVSGSARTTGIGRVGTLSIAGATGQRPPTLPAKTSANNNHSTRRRSVAGVETVCAPSPQYVGPSPRRSTKTPAATLVHNLPMTFDYVARESRDK